jgi:dGTPase
MPSTEFDLETLEDGAIRERIESNQEKILENYACKATDSSGRLQQEYQDPIRNCFQLDRDRILYTGEFRRLKFKTQVFIERVNDDTRTRLTHTLEVMQISRTVARALGLNEDLTEAIALGHDIGHTPFAHSGETVLDDISENGFHHSNQSLRVVDYLANEGDGLNLTREVRDGIVKHSKTEESMFDSVSGSEPNTLEGSVVRMCDSIAYINHDIDDAMRAGILQSEELPNKALSILGDHGGERINRTVKDIIVSSCGEGELMMSPEIRDANDSLRSYMFDKVYHELGDQPTSREARGCIRELYEYFTEHPSIIYDYCPFLETVDTSDPIIDFLSLQSDLTTVNLYNEHLEKELPHIPSYS